MTSPPGWGPRWSPYRLVVLGTDRSWADEVATVCVDAAAEILDGGPAVAVLYLLPPEEDDDPALTGHTLVILLAEKASRDDPGLRTQLDDAVRRGLRILPVVRQDADVHAVLPEPIARLNAVTWQQGGAGVARDVLRLLGLVEESRRLFLSYRRVETAALAVQLRDHLSRRRFDVFLDRFSVAPAEHFQRRINIELSDRAFVLLLESPSAGASEWVRHEVTYALLNRIPVRALTLPTVTAAQKIATLHDGFRFPLEPTDLCGPDGGPAPADDPDARLKQSTLDRVLDTIECEYARGLWRRRAEILGSVAEWLDRIGHTPRPIEDEWALLGGRDEPAVYLVTPHGPRPHDLRRLDALRASAEADAGGPVHGHLLHTGRDQDRDSESLLTWIINRRPLSSMPHDAAPDLLGP